MLLMIDNYDSFSYNIVNILSYLGNRVQIFYNDKITLDECFSYNPHAFILGPGPGSPCQVNLNSQLILEAANKNIPLLGICLGMQAIGETFGGKIIRASKPMHGKISPVNHIENGLFSGIPQDFNVTRYHSLVVDRLSLPSSLQITAESPDKEIMGLKHLQYPIEGIQFHPEAVATEYGIEIFKNWLQIISV